MGRKLIGGTVGTASVAVDALKHVFWYVSHQISASPRDKDER